MWLDAALQASSSLEPLSVQCVTQWPWGKDNEGAILMAVWMLVSVVLT